MHMRTYGHILYVCLHLTWQWDRILLWHTLGQPMCSSEKVTFGWADPSSPSEPILYRTVLYCISWVSMVAQRLLLVRTVIIFISLTHCDVDTIGLSPQGPRCKAQLGKRYWAKNTAAIHRCNCDWCMIWYGRVCLSFPQYGNERPWNLK